MSRQIALFILLLIHTSSFAYDVALKNGKILTGEVVSENATVLVLRDSSGVKLHIKKETIDVIETAQRNKKMEPVKLDRGETTPVIGEKPKIERELKKKTRVYKKEDLAKLPELSIIGREESADEVRMRNESRERAMQEQELEAEWNEAALQIDDRIREARESYESNKNFCDKVIPSLQDMPAGVYTELTAEQYEQQRRIACMEAEAAAKDLEDAEVEYEEFLEDARKKGIPPGWVDPDRIRN